MKKLLKYLRPYIKECVIAPSFKMLEALFELFVPLVMTKIIDEGIVGRSREPVIRNGIILVMLGVIGLVCALIAQYFAARAAIGFASGIRSDLYRHVFSLSYADYDKIGTPTLITRLTGDIDTAQNGVNMSLRLLLRSPFIVFGAMIMAFTVNVRSALIFVVVIPILFVIVSLVTLYTIPRYRAIQKKLDRLTLHFGENLQGARVIRSFSANDDEEAEFIADNDEFCQMNLFVSRISAILSPATLIIVNLALTLLVYRGGSLVSDGILTSGQVIALINYMSQILVELVKLTNLFITINKALASGGRIADTLALVPSIADEGTIDATAGTDSCPGLTAAAEADSGLSAPGSALLEFDRVSFAYPGGGSDALTDISFSIKKGETIGVIGGTGSGKSTLAGLIARFYDPRSGEIRLSGRALPAYTVSSLRRRISVVPQKAQLFSGTIRDNLMLGIDRTTPSDGPAEQPEPADDILREALSISEAAEIVEKKSEGLDYMLTEAGSNLSGGQRQRLTIARAIAAGGDILILDDSSSALDYATDSRLRSNLKALKDRYTTVIISQRVVSVKDADRILVLDDGRLAGFGTHEQLIKDCSTYREIVASQSEEEAV